MTNVFRQTEEWLQAHQAKRARECAKTDQAGKAVAAPGSGRDSNRAASTGPLSETAPACREREQNHAGAGSGPLERDVQASILSLLDTHPAVAWAHRFNTGGVEREYKGEKRYIAFAFPGCSDILGQMKDGRFLAIECKRPGKKATEEQAAFLATVTRNRGVAILATSIDDVLRGLRYAA